MQRQYRMWDQQAERAVVPLTAESIDRLVTALAAGRSVEVGGQVLMKIQVDDFFKSAQNTTGDYVLAVFEGGQVVAAAESSEAGALMGAVLCPQGIAQGELEDSGKPG